MPSLAEEFRQSVARRREEKPRPGRYSNRLRELALEHLAAVRSEGGHASRAARELGIDANTLRAWEQASAKRVTTSPAQLLPVMTPLLHRLPQPSAPYVIQGPAGLRIDCASADAVAALIRALA